MRFHQWPPRKPRQWSRKSNYGSFTKLGEQSREDVRAIIEEASKGSAAKGTDAQKVGDLYTSFMNLDRLNEIGTKPLLPEFAKIDAIENTSDLSEYIAYAQIMSRAPFKNTFCISQRWQSFRA